MRLCVVDIEFRGSPPASTTPPAGTVRPAGTVPPASTVPGPAGQNGAGAEAAVAALYQADALGLVRLAYVMLGDRAGAEDVVQDAFGGLYRRWDQLSDKERALPYVRSSVLNGCRSALRRLRRADVDGVPQPPPAASAETAVLTSEERREVMRALRRLPDRQREVLVLRFYLDQPEAAIAQAMGIGQSTVRSTAHRALAALGAGGAIEVRLLDADAPGGVMPSRLGVEWTRGDVTGANGAVIIRGSRANPANSLRGYNTLITPDGTKIVCLTAGTTVNGVTEFDAAVARVVSDTYPQGTDVLWTNASGSTLIVSNASTVGVLAGGHFTPLPDASDVGIMSAW
jgi:RNA polymerase sigma-70 factor (sigma-E family)